jgi:DNA-binding FadR family transcriptional regulator
VQENVSVKASISRQIAEQLRSAIVAGQFKIGQRLPTEDELAKRFGVSRPSVREALKRLAAQNLVRARRGPTGGNFVVQPSYAELAESLSGAATLLVGMGALGIEEIIEARRTLQGSCMQLASSTSETLTSAMKTFAGPTLPSIVRWSTLPITACSALSCIR